MNFRVNAFSKTLCWPYCWDKWLRSGYWNRAVLWSDGWHRSWLLSNDSAKCWNLYRSVNWNNNI